MNSRYDCIRRCNSDLTEIRVDYRVTEDLTQVGGSRTVLREFQKKFELGFSPKEVAAEVEAFVNEMKERADALAAKYGYSCVIMVE